ncbi:MAG: nucleotidyltransferase family protein [Nitrospirae bacterium]|nr:nucleotidyltransferase family protein [Nitrospirota bacterium]
MRTDQERFCIDGRSTVREAMARMTANGLSIVLVVDEGRRLVGTITDGDVRRAILADTNLDAPVENLLRAKKGTRFERPVTAREGATAERCIALFQKHRMFHLPILDSEGRVAGLVSQKEFLPDEICSVRAVVVAGGEGRRLRPLTEELPKPMLPVGDRPLIERIVGQLRDAGIKRVHITTHYRSEKITEHLGDGRDFGIEIGYVVEDRPLGTAGGLAIMDRTDETLLVINGDVLSHVNYRAMLSFHREHGADLTVAVRSHRVAVPYGVVECEGHRVTDLKEKPCLTFFINAGIYLLEPSVLQRIPVGESLDMTDVINDLLNARKRVVSFPIHEYWSDVGQPDDYERVQREVQGASAMAL